MIQRICPDKLIRVHDRAMSFVDFVLQDFITWGNREMETNPPAEKPMISIGFMRILFIVTDVLSRTEY
jgi:hypothetical protein